MQELKACVTNPTEVPDPQPTDLRRLIDGARRALPAAHRGLLEQISAQDLVVENWPGEVLDLYRTVRALPPVASQLDGSLAVWLEGPRVVAYNAAVLRHVLTGLDPPSTRHVVERLAWHEYGHALSATRATDELRREGPRLLELLPPGIREAIDYPGSYARRQVFDEIVANVFPLLVERAVRANDYGRPQYLHEDIFDALLQVLPWPPVT